MKTAVVHDWLNGMRGGEKVLEAILPLVPEPTIFTLFHVPGSVSAAIERHPIRASCLNRLPFSRRHYRHYLPLFPGAVESFDLSGFDLVVSSSHCVAKGAIAPPGVPHLCYCHTPVRYAYEQFDLYFPPRAHAALRALKAAAIARLRALGRRDRVAPDALPRQLLRRRRADPAPLRPAGAGRAIRPSTSTSSGPRTRRGRAATSCSPSARSCRTSASRSRSRPRACSAAGSSSSAAGPRRARLSRARAVARRDSSSGSSAEELRELYRTCALYLQPGEEDFGISAVEALACGAPVVALGRGGALRHRAGRRQRRPLRGRRARGLGGRRSRGRRWPGSTTLPCAPRRCPFGGERFAAEFRRRDRESSCEVIRKSTRRIAILMLVSDVGATLVALAAAYFLRFRAEIVPVTKGIPDVAPLLPALPRSSPCSGRSSTTSTASTRCGRNRSRVEEAISVLVATGLATLLLAGLATFYRGFSYSRLVLLLLLRPRRPLRLRGPHGHPPLPRGGVAPRRRRPAACSSSAPGGSGARVVDKLVEHPEAGLRAVGFVDDAAGQARLRVPRRSRPRRDGRGRAHRGRARRRHGLPRAAARGAPHDARRPPGGRPHDRRRARRAGPPAAHHLPRRRRGPGRPAGRPPDAGPAHGLDEPRQAHPRRRHLGRGARRSRRRSSPRSPRRSGSPTAARSSTGSAAWAWTAARSTS